MENEKDPLSVFYNEADRVLVKKISEVDELVRMIDDSLSEQDIIAVLKDANALLRLVCEGDSDLYDEWRYRLFKVDKGKYIIVQGNDLSVDPDNPDTSED